MRTTKRTIVSAICGLAMAAVSAPVMAEGDPADGNWLNSRCKSARLARAAALEKIEGHVTVRYDIAANGRVTNIRVIDSQPSNIMDRAVTNAIRGWRYFAYIKDGVEAGRTDVEMTFTFGGEASAKEAACAHTPWPETTTAQAK